MANKSEPSLLGLPPELRNRIYELVARPIHSETERRLTGGTHKYLVPRTISRVCRQTRLESIPIYFSEADISFEGIVLRQHGSQLIASGPVHPRWDWQKAGRYFAYLDSLGPAAIKHIRSASFKLDLPDAQDGHHYHLTLDFAGMAATVRHYRRYQGSHTDSYAAMGELGLKMLLERCLREVDFEGEDAPGYRVVMRGLETRLCEWFSDPSHPSCYFGACE